MLAAIDNPITAETGEFVAIADAIEYNCVDDVDFVDELHNDEKLKNYSNHG